MIKDLAIIAGAGLLLWLLEQRSPIRFALIGKMLRMFPSRYVAFVFFAVTVSVTGWVFQGLYFGWPAVMHAMNGEASMPETAACRQIYKESKGAKVCRQGGDRDFLGTVPYCTKHGRLD